MRRLLLVATTAFVAALGASAGVAVSQDAKMSFFVTSVESRQGRRSRRPRRRRRLLRASSPRPPASPARPGMPISRPAAENARDRIGSGPWYNAKGEKIADDVASLHGDANGLTKADGAHRKGRGGERPRRHPEHARHPHRLEPRRHRLGPDLRRLDAERRRRGRHVGHQRPHRPRRFGRGEVVELLARDSRGGCSLDALTGTGGAGLFYCFAAD